MNKNSLPVFTYGTLLPGMEREFALASATSLGPSLLEAVLFDLGPYPGIREGAGQVVGELWEVDELTLQRLDAIEGHRDGDPAGSLFYRKEVDVRMFSDGSTVPAWSYFARQEGGEPIEHGDYRRWRLEKGEKSQWLLSYGSNMGTSRLQRRVGELNEREQGSLSGFELVLNKQSGVGSQANAKANIRWRGGEASCPGVVDFLRIQQIQALDPCEGAPHHYLRVAVQFQATEWSAPRLVQAYIAHPNKLNEDLQPNEDYLQHIQNGYEEFGFGEVS